MISLPVAGRRRRLCLGRWRRPAAGHAQPTAAIADFRPRRPQRLGTGADDRRHAPKPRAVRPAQLCQAGTAGTGGAAARRKNRAGAVDLWRIWAAVLVLVIEGIRARRQGRG